MKEKFNDRESYRRELESVYSFHRKVYDTVLNYLKEHGDRVITDEDNRPDEWRFAFLEMEGSYEVTAVRLSEDGKDFYLDTTSESGDVYHIDWSMINHDMVITEMLMDLVFPEPK